VKVRFNDKKQHYANTRHAPFPVTRHTRSNGKRCVM